MDLYSKITSTIKVKLPLSKAVELLIKVSVAATKYTYRYRIFNTSGLSFQGDRHGLQAYYTTWLFILELVRNQNSPGVAFHNIHRQF